MLETVIKLDKQLKVKFWMRNRHDRPSDADIRQEAYNWAIQKAKTEDIEIVKVFVPDAVMHHVDVIHYENLKVKQGQTLGTNERHWEAEGDGVYYLYYTH